MRTRRSSLIAVVTLVCLACGTARERSLSDAERTAIADTIRKLKGAIVEAFDGQNCEFEFPVSDSLVSVTDGRLAGTQRPTSRSDMINLCKALNEQRVSARDDVQEEGVYVLGPNAAYIVSRSVYTVQRRDGRTIIRPLVATGIWSRQSEGWRLVHFHESWRESEEQTVVAEEDAGGAR